MEHLLEVNPPDEPQGRSVPRRKSAEKERREGERSPGRDSTQSKSNLTAGSIAVVDDENDIARLVAIYLRRQGYRVELVAHNGEEIVRAVESSRIRPDLILMDYRMPGMDGLEAAKEILRSSPVTKIVMITGYEDIKESLQSEGIGFLQKPFSLAALRRVVEESLSA